MNEPILIVENVKKKFSRTLRSSAINGLKDLVSDLAGKRASRDYLRSGEFWALYDVSFDVMKGESVGIVGANGSGKSTLLRLISGIYPPDAGRIEVRGRVGALISLGAGFNPHMTGRENIFLNGALLGMSRSEIQEKLDRIIEFAEIGEFIDAPVSTYSSGMTVRLGFSIAAHAEPELLIVDEIMAVGDLAFSLKCHRKMADYRKSGGTTLLVSHSNQLIRNVCSRAIWLQNGICRKSGNTDEVCAAYEAQQLSSTSIPSQTSQRLCYDDSLSIENVYFNGIEAELSPTVNSVSELEVTIIFNAKRKIAAPKLSVFIETVDGVLAHASFSFEDGSPIEQFAPGKTEACMRFKNLRLKTGVYYLSITLAEHEIGNVLAWHQRAYSFKVYGAKANQGIVDLQPSWRFRHGGGVDVFP